MGYRPVSPLDIYPLGVYSICMEKKDEFDINSQVKHRISIIKGQLDGLLKMIKEDQYCIDLLNQSLSIQNSLKSLESVILERHLRKHVADQFKSQKEKAIYELLKVFKRKQKGE